MPLSIPTFDQYQAPMVPLRGLWNSSPPEGDKLVNAEIDWLVTTKNQAVQFQLAGNSPVALSQIVALYVDNARCGADINFLFPDTGFSLFVQARSQGIFPVLTNALMFYAISNAAQVGDTTVLQILNSMPPPIPIPATVAQNTAATGQIGLANGSTPVVAAGISGTLNSVSIVVNATAAASLGVITLILQDGTGKTLWRGAIEVLANQTVTIPINLPGLSLRFSNGINLVMTGASNISGYVTANAYYSTP